MPGTLRPEVAQRLGLPEAVAVAVGNVDSFVSVPGAGVARPGSFVMVIGTSICDMVVAHRGVPAAGDHRRRPRRDPAGAYGYEAGQVAVGDMLAWFVDTSCPASGGVPTRRWRPRPRSSRPGSTGLLALDWWNGNRTILADADLTGAIFGLNLQSSPAEIYRALLESIAFGNRRIMDNFEEHGMPLEQIVACGGIAEKSPLMMQLVADISGRPVVVLASSEIPARGAALFGGLAAGAFGDLAEAVERDSARDARTYTPDPAAKEVYDRVYAIYRELYEVLGRSHSQWLHGLKRIRAEQHR